VPVDLSQDNFLSAIEQATADVSVGLLVNNAAIATTGQFLDNDLGSELALLHVNSRAPLILTHCFGRSMRQRGRGGIIFVASTVAFAGVPSMSNYAGLKAHDLVFAEGLARELRHDGISVLALCPGPTRTELWPSGSDPGTAMQPGTVMAASVGQFFLPPRTALIVALSLDSICQFIVHAGNYVDSREAILVNGRRFPWQGRAGQAPPPRDRRRRLGPHPGPPAGPTRTTGSDARTRGRSLVRTRR